VTVYDFDPEWTAKLDELREAGRNPYPGPHEHIDITHYAANVHSEFKKWADPVALVGKKYVSVGGRLMYRNKMGKSMFLRLQDSTGIIQVYVRKENVPEGEFDWLKKLDIGDIVCAHGYVFRTKAGEITIMAGYCQLAAKTLMPMPDRQHGVQDVETRARQRYVDLYMNEDSRKAFIQRSKIVRAIRNFFDNEDYIEVETPSLQTIPGGANAKPFETHHNALDIPMFMRIAPELFLKRLIVGGLDRVFEIGKNFRNEGVSTKHNPEFTTVEFYAAWECYENLMDQIENLVRHLAGVTADPEDGYPMGEVVGIQFGGVDIDLAGPWRRATMAELVQEATGETATGTKLLELFEEHVEHTLINPTFVTGYPVEVSPLAKRNHKDPTIVDRFELFINGWEIANGFNELNDPVDQAARFQAQAEARADGDDEAMYFDADYIRALSYGMPPTAGAGIGVDRLVMLLTDRQSIREVILFPTMRPE